MKILYEDNHIIVLIKPAGILSQAVSKGEEDLISLIKDYLREKYSKPGNIYLGLVHRLDRNVEGLIVLAKTSKASARLSEAIRDRKFQKRYLAVVEVQDLFDLSNNGRLEHWLIKDERERKSHILNEQKDNSQKAILDYQVLQKSIVSDRELALVEIDLLTGRFHQIRAQLSFVGLPIYGDVKYGSSVKDAIALYAYSLSFPHPITKEIIQFKSLPEETFPWSNFEIKEGAF